MSLLNSSETIWNRTRDLPPCDTVPSYLLNSALFTFKNFVSSQIQSSFVLNARHFVPLFQICLPNGHTRTQMVTDFLALHGSQHGTSYCTSYIPDKTAALQHVNNAAMSDVARKSRLLSGWWHHVLGKLNN